MAAVQWCRVLGEVLVVVVYLGFADISDNVWSGKGLLASSLIEDDKC